MEEQGMKMIRKYMAMFLALALTSALSGCGSTSQSSESAGGSGRKISEAETTAAAEQSEKESAAENKNDAGASAITYAKKAIHYSSKGIFSSMELKTKSMLLLEELLNRQLSDNQ